MIILKIKEMMYPQMAMPMANRTAGAVWASVTNDPNRIQNAAKMITPKNP